MSEHAIDIVPNLVSGQKRDGRCVYSAEAKQELVRRCQEPGVSVAAMALAHGLNANLLRKWITLAQRSNNGGCADAPVMLPVRAVAEPSLPAVGRSDGFVEVVLSVTTIRVHGRVSADMLRMAVDCLVGRS